MRGWLSVKHLPCECKDPSFDSQDLYNKLGMRYNKLGIGASASNPSAEAVEAEGFQELIGLKCQPLGHPDSQEGGKSLRNDTQSRPLSSVALHVILAPSHTERSSRPPG